jgi:hypothetical protein
VNLFASWLSPEQLQDTSLFKWAELVNYPLPLQSNWAHLYDAFDRPIRTSPRAIEFAIAILDLRVAQYTSRLESYTFYDCTQDAYTTVLFTPPTKLFDSPFSSSIVSLCCEDILEILRGLGRLRTQLVDVLLQWVSLSSFIKSIFLAEQSFFEYNGNGRPPTPERVLRMDLVPAI